MSKKDTGITGVGIDLPEELADEIKKSIEEKELMEEQHEKATKWINNYGIKHSIEMFAKNTDMNRPKINIKYEIGVGGGSYTDGINTRLGLSESWLNRNEKDWVRYMKFVAAHELGHVNWSDFGIFVDFKKRAESYFEKKFDIRGAGKLAGNLLNITEDGRIERGQANLMPGLRKYIRYVNGVEYDSFPSNQLGIVPLHDFMNTSLMLSKVGLLPEGYEERIEGTDTGEAVTKAMPHIVDAIRSQTAKGCADATWEILLANEDFIAEAMEPFQMDEEDIQNLLNSDMSESSGSGDSSSAGGTGMPGHSEKSEDASEKTSQSENPEESDSPEGADKSEAGAEDEAGEKSGKGKMVDIDPMEGIDGEADYKNNPSMGDIDDGGETTHFGDEDDLKEGKAESKSLSKNKGEKDDDSSEINTSLDELIVETDSDSLDFLDKAKEVARRENDRIVRESAERKKTDVSDKEVNGVLSEYKGPMDFEYVNEVFVDNGPLPQSIKTAGLGLRRDLKEIFNDKRGWTLSNQRSGMLDESQLYRAGSSLRQNDVFIKRQIPEDSNWVVSVLVDNSGSMQGGVHDDSGHYLGPKTTVAREATAMLEVALNGLVPIKITRFDLRWAGTDVVQHAQVRGWEQKNKEILSWKSTDDAGSGNADAMSIGVAVEELKNRPESKKLLIVLSDGLPAENTPQQVKKVIEESRKEGVKIVGIGFGSERELERNADTYNNMYDKDVVLTMPENLSKELVKILRATIARGG